jgi:hypothetical protein
MTFYFVCELDLGLRTHDDNMTDDVLYIYIMLSCLMGFIFM